LLSANKHFSIITKNGVMSNCPLLLEKKESPLYSEGEDPTLKLGSNTPLHLGKERISLKGGDAFTTRRHDP